MSNVAAGKDTDDEGEVLNDVEKALNSYGIALRNSKKEWRSFEDVLDEVAEKWNKFSGTEQSHIATAIAGTRQQENFRAMMNNWDEVTRLAEVAASSTGSATERMNIYLESVEAKTNNLKTAWEQFVMSLNQSESWKQLLDMLTAFLEKLTYVDWDKVLKVLITFLSLSALVKVFGAISSAIAAIKSAAAIGGTIAGVVSAASGLLPVLLAIAGVVTAIGVAWKSVKNNSESTLEDIEERRNALQDEEKDVKELYKRYSELEGKSKYYSLTAEEKQELLDITKTLVEQYGFETDGIDSLTGGYKLANDALEKYIANLEREKRLLTSDEEKTLKKEAKEDIGDIKKAKEQKKVYEDNFGKKFLTGTDEEKKEIIKLFGQLGVGEQKKSYAGTQVFSDTYKEGQRMSDEAKKTLKEKYGYDDKEFLTNDPLSAYSLFRQKLQSSGMENWALPSKWTDDGLNSFLDYFYKNVTSDYNKQDVIVSAKGKEVAEDITKLLRNKLGEDVNTSIADTITNSITQALSQDGMVEGIKDVDAFVEDYTNTFINKINANGKELGLVFDRYKELQDRANKGILNESEYDEYKNSLHTYIEMQKEALKATGLSEEKINELMKSFEQDAVKGLNIQLLELNKNLKDSDKFSQDTKNKYSQFISEITSLQSSFKTGAIDSNKYFEQLSKKIDNIDTGNLEELNKTFGDTTNYLKTISALWGDTKNYLDNIWTTFQGGGDSLEFLNEFDSVANTIVTLTNSLQKLDEASSEIDLTKITTSKEDVKRNVDNRINSQPESFDQKINVDMSQIEKAIDYINNLDGKDLDVQIEADGLKDAEDGFDDLLHIVRDTSEGTLDLKDNTDDLLGSLKELEDLKLNEVDSAFETLKNGFSELTGDVKSLVGTTNDEIKNSAQYMSQWIFDIANSNKDYAQTAKQAIIDITSNTGVLISDIAETNVDSFAKALMADEQNANTFAAAANNIASQSMQTAVKNLGKTLETMGTALATLNISVPIKLKGADTNIKVAGVPIVSLGFDGLDTELTIGGEGTKGLSDIGNSLAEFGKSLQDDSVSQIIANQFTPVQSEYTPTLSNDGKSGGSGNKGHTPSGGGSKNKKSGSEYTPEEAEKDKKSILNDIEDYEKDIEADLEDQTEQLINHYNLERNKLDTLREELDYYDSIYDSVEDTTKWLETQLKILDEESDKVSEMQNANEKIDAQRKKIYAENKQYNVESWFDSEGNDTLAYGDMLNNFEYQKEAIQQETARKMRAEYNKIANSTDKDVIKDAKEKIKLIEEEGDLKIKELDKEKEKVENIHDSVETLNDAWDENQEKIRESLQELNDRIKDVRDTLIDQMMEQLEEATDKMNKSIEKDVTRLEQLKQIQESYNSILNDTIDTQDELLDELQANLDSYQYLDEDMRQLMFNEDDYKKLSGVLGDIQKDIADIWEDHYNQIQNLTEDEMYKAEYITAETERQLATKQKQYELAKAELDIAKAKTNLENVKNERNTRIFANGEWKWVADPTAVRDAQKQVSDAERAKNKIEREEEQQKLIDGLDRLIDADNLQIDKNNELLEKIKEAIEAETKEVKSIDDALDNIKTTNLPDLNTTLVNALGEDGGHMTELLRSINKSQTTLAAALRGQTVDQAVNQLKSGKMDKKAFEELVTRLGYSFNETTGKVTTQDGSFDAHYSGWTKKSNNDTQTTTGKNGVQVTGNKPSGNGGQQQSSPASSIQSVNNKNSQEELKRIAKEVWQGKWGNGQNRKDRLAAAGYDYAAVQALVNKGRSYFFDQGGVSTGIGLMAKDTLEPERVLSPRQTKSFENLVNNLTTNPVLNALSRNPSVVSNLPNMGNTTSNDKNYYFSNFTVQANDIGQFIDSIETMLPMKN